MNFIYFPFVFIAKFFMRLLLLAGLIGDDSYEKVRNLYRTSKKKIAYNSIFSARARKQYLDWCLNHMNDRSKFVPLSDRRFERRHDDPKIIAYYLPQFYEFEMNNKWFGRGFTEWTNVTKAFPQFEGHYQPRLPIDVGFYNLDTTKTMHRQVELAKQYGIYGFCFYYYWFHGERIMEKPIFNFLEDKSIDMPFMLFWANENWTKNWDPNDNSEMGAKVFDATHTSDEAAKFLDDITPFFDDPRYISTDGRPNLIIYKHNKYPYMAEFIAELKKESVRRGRSEPYVMLIPDDDNINKFHPKQFNADAVTEFALYSFRRAIPHKIKKMMNSNGQLTPMNMNAFIENQHYMCDVDFPINRNVMTTFDNTSRKIKTDAILYDIPLGLYKKWLSVIVKWTREKSPESLVFVSAWNEWAEAMYLEPDIKYGYAYLDTTRQVLEEARK